MKQQTNVFLLPILKKWLEINHICTKKLNTSQVIEVNWFWQFIVTETDNVSQLLFPTQYTFPHSQIIWLFSNQNFLSKQECAGCDGPLRSLAVRSYPSPKVRGSDRERRSGSQEELPHIQGQGQQPRGTTHAGGQGPAGEELLHARGQGRGPEEQPHLQGAAAARAQEGQEELLHVQGQEGQLWGDTPRPRSGAGAVLCWSSCEEIPHVQGKRNPSKTVAVARGHQRAETLKP